MPPLYKTLIRWVNFCADQADKHADKASYLKTLQYLLVGLTLVCTGLATVISGLGSQFSDDGEYAYVALSAAATATVLTGLNAVVEPAGRRKEHLASELQYVVLARDISTFIVTHPPTKDRNFVYASTEILTEYQRRLDNLEAMAPPI